MPQLTIVAHGDTAAVVLSAVLLEPLGLRVGGLVDVTLADRQLVLQSVDDADRRRRVDAITQEVIERRRDAYQRLA